MDQDIFFMQETLKLAEKTLREGQFPVACLISFRGEIVASSQRKESSENIPSEIKHAEILALREFEKKIPREKRHESCIYVNLEPCLMCYGAILISGIGRLVWAYEDAMGGATSCPLDKLAPLYSESRLKTRASFHREESLKLFKEFFKNPENKYWKDSLLAEYTLKA